MMNNTIFIAKNKSKMLQESDFKKYEMIISKLPSLQEVYPNFNIPNNIVHRKNWEWAFIISTLERNGLLAKGKRGLGFAVGCEPLPSYFASLGVEVMATDMWGNENMWTSTGQNLMGNFEELNRYGLCDKKDFDKLVRLENVDMNNIPDKYRDYDFCWSSCAVEHVGNMELAIDFFEKSLKVLKKGGLSIHAVEYNVASNDNTITEGDTVIFRKRDLEKIRERVRGMGAKMIATFRLGKGEGDKYIDIPPYYSNPKYHLHLQIGEYESTSYGIIIQK